MKKFQNQMELEAIVSKMAMLALNSATGEQEALEIMRLQRKAEELVEKLVDELVDR